MSDDKVITTVNIQGLTKSKGTGLDSYIETAAKIDNAGFKILYAHVYKERGNEWIIISNQTPENGTVH